VADDECGTGAASFSRFETEADWLVQSRRPSALNATHAAFVK